jgi:hypothetical protein
MTDRVGIFALLLAQQRGARSMARDRLHYCYHHVVFHFNAYAYDDGSTAVRLRTISANM